MTPDGIEAALVDLAENPRCIAEARHKVTHYSSPHTFRCQKPEGHDGAHEHKHDTRTVTWYGEARKQEDNTRFRFGFGLHKTAAE